MPAFKLKQEIVLVIERGLKPAPTRQTVCEFILIAGDGSNEMNRDVVGFPVPGEFLLMPRLVFGTALDNVAANDTIVDSHLWTRTLRSEFLPSKRHDCETRCSSL